MFLLVDSTSSGFVSMYLTHRERSVPRPEKQKADFPRRAGVMKRVDPGRLFSRAIQGNPGSMGEAQFRPWIETVTRGWDTLHVCVLILVRKTINHFLMKGFEEHECSEFLPSINPMSSKSVRKSGTKVLSVISNDRVSHTKCSIDLADGSGCSRSRLLQDKATV
jgi:hypothetical protein